MSEFIEKLYVLSVFIRVHAKSIVEIIINSSELWFPSIQIIISFLAAVTYWLNGDTRKSIYWLAAGILTITVTF